MTDSFPRQKARTRNFTLGAPRSFHVGADRVVFLRSPAGDDPQTALWVLDVAQQRERLVVDPATLSGGPEFGHALTAQERARRERTRETGGGIVSYATDRDATIAALSYGGRLFVADLVGGGARELRVPGPVFDPRPDPAGTRIAYVRDRALYVCGLDGGAVTFLAGEDDPAVSWATAEFVAAEEMDRFRGYWWAPDGSALLATRVDESAVDRVWISDPAHPTATPAEVRYPLAGSTNADVTLYLLALDGGPRTEVAWDRQRYPYLVTAGWDRHGPLISVQTRDQRQVVILAVDRATGGTSTIGHQRDDDWVEVIEGVPGRLEDARLVTVGGSGEAISLCIAGDPVTPPGLELRAVVTVDDDAIVFTATDIDKPTEIDVWRWTAQDGLSRLSSSAGVHTAAAGHGLTVLGSSGMEHFGTTWTLNDHQFRSEAEQPLIEPKVQLLTVGERDLVVGLLLPSDHEPGRRLPVLLDPYGGPQFQRVQTSRHQWLESQWLADQGFAVVVVDGRGTPGRGRGWARAIRGDLAAPPLQDQVDALLAVATEHPDLDLDRVGIRGWSFGGYLAALAILRRPDVFHAAVAGAPVSDWRLYDTHYSERFLGSDPDGADRDAYDRSAVLADAPSLRRPLLLIHGLADDNVLAAHTLQLSQRLTESGVSHAVLPLTGVTHMTPQENVAENLLTIQVQFLHEALRAPAPA